MNLDVGASAPIVLIHGENMRGKTSILRAIIWCLYGKLKNQDGRTNLSVSRLVNQIALDLDSDIPFQIELKLEHRGREYTLTRGGVANRIDDTSVVTTQHFVQLLPKDGNPLAAEFIDEFVATMLSYDVSDFFFFDGEMLNRFEERLREDREISRPFVRKQIERALGLPFLRLLESDLAKIQAQVESDMKKSLRANKRAEALSDDHRRASDEMASAQKDSGKLKERDATLQEEFEGIERQLQAVDSIKEQYYARLALESEVDAKSRDLSDLLAECRNDHDSKWWFPLGNRIAAEQVRVSERIGEESKSQERSYALKYQLDGLRARLGSEPCPTCGQEIHALPDPSLPQKISDLEKELEGLKPQGTGELRQRLSNLSKYGAASAAVAKIQQSERDRLKLSLDIDHARARIKDIEELLPAEDVDIASLESRRRTIRDNIAKGKRLIEASELKISSLRSQVSALGREIRKNPGVGREDRRRHTTVSTVSEIVSNSFDEFSHQMRQQVQNEATSLFKQLTTEKQFTGVSINPDYSLSILDSRGLPVDLTSAGGNQIVTMSFIGALAACSAEEAPMVMDTPFGRLDVGHRESILRWVKESTTQIMLFVQSGEYDASRDGHVLGSKIGRQYKIQRLNERESSIVGLNFDE